MKLSDLLQSVTQNTASIDGVRWYPVRPMTAENTFLLPRAKAAWRVLAGKSDAIEWDYPEEIQHVRKNGSPYAVYKLDELIEMMEKGNFKIK